MKIGIDASRANREHKSGTEWYSYYLIRKLAQLDSKNQYILYTDKPLRGELLDLRKEGTNLESAKREVTFDKKGYQEIKSPHNNFKAKVLNWPFSFFWTLGRLSLEMIFNKPDVLFIPAHSIPLVYPQKTLATIHDVAFYKSNFLYRSESIGPEKRVFKKLINFLVRVFTLNKYRASSLDYLKWSTNFTLKHASRIISVSESTRQDILDVYKVDPQKISVVYNGFNKRVYNESNFNRKKQEEVLEKYGLERPFLLYVGRLEKKKNVPLLIEAFAKVKDDNPDMDLNLVLAGDAGYGYDEVIYNIAGLDLYSQVYMPGWVDEEDMICLYSAASAFIFPSRHEGFGIPILQAFACRIPVTASCIPPFQEIGKKAILYFNPIDRKEMARAISSVVTDEKLREELIKKGSERVKKFSWEKCAQDTLEVINKM